MIPLRYARYYLIFIYQLRVETAVWPKTNYSNINVRELSIEVREHDYFSYFISVI